MISPQLLGPIILGNGFAREIGLVINFQDKCFSFEKNGNIKKYVFSQ
jgi:hypothetical protein